MTARLFRGKGDGTHAWEGEGSTQGGPVSFPENRGAIGLRSPPAPLRAGDTQGCVKP